MKLAMLDTAEALRKSGLRGRMLLQVHDELILECPESETEETARLVQSVLAKAYKLKVPLVTDARSGPNWYEMRSVGI